HDPTGHHARTGVGPAELLGLVAVGIPALGVRRDEAVADPSRPPCGGVGRPTEDDGGATRASRRRRDLHGAAAVLERLPVHAFRNVSTTSVVRDARLPDATPNMANSSAR